MQTRIAAAVATCVLFASQAMAQDRHWAVLGDTSGGPAGCAAAAVHAIDAFERGMRTADPVVLDSAFAGQFIFSAGKWAPADTFVRAGNVTELVAYARKRMRAQERLSIRSVQFTYWRRGRELHFGPMVFDRSARDLAVRTHTARAKGMYLCGEGLRVLNLGRPPSS